VLVAGAVLFSFASPRLAERSVQDSNLALEDEDFVRARDSALRARLFNPYSPEPLLALARASERAGALDAAGERYAEAVELQPENPETWYALGLFEFYARQDLCAAYEALQTSWDLDSAGDQWLPGGELDQSREAATTGECEPP
jgi:Flp pilus assembly protein TadD